MSDMHVMDRSGHTTITWDPDATVEVTTAREAFDRLIQQGYNAFRVEGADNRGERIRSFEPKAGKIMMVPQLVGG
jgi:hypothetical protein